MPHIFVFVTKRESKVEHDNIKLMLVQGNAWQRVYPDDDSHISMFLLQSLYQVSALLNEYRLPPSILHLR